jgi:hypothetical protein
MRKTLSNKQIEKWVQRQRLEYAAGTLSKRKIDRLERIPGWSWAPENSEQRINPAISQG